MFPKNGVLKLIILENGFYLLKFEPEVEFRLFVGSKPCWKAEFPMKLMTELNEDNGL
jgi:hypothetical protein